MRLNIIPIAIIILSFLNSCSKNEVTDSPDSNNSNPVVVKKLTDVNLNAAIIYTYKGNKIDKIQELGSEYYEQFTYSGDLIILKETIYKTGPMDISQYTYQDNRIKTIKQIRSNTFYDQYDFTYNSDGSVDTKSSEFLTKLVFDNMGNVIKKITNLVSTKIPTITTDYVYDKKINPFNNIIGYNKIAGFERVINDDIDPLTPSINNIISSTTRFSNSSNTNVMTYNYIYNNNNYPVSVSFTQTFLSGRPTINLQYEY